MNEIMEMNDEEGKLNGTFLIASAGASLGTSSVT
jgi:hypothetical protein